MPKNFHNRLKNIIKESLGDLSWIQNSESKFNPKFDFDGKEYWVDVSKIDIAGRKKIVNYITKTVTDFSQFAGDELADMSRGNKKGIIIHCGSDMTDFEPEEGLICASVSSYEDDYEIDNPNADISKSIYIDGREVIEFINLTNDEEELDESLEWSDKDEPFDEKDKSFENDPSWKDDEDWSLNPERSYWKQGDAGGSGGGDVNESEELDWIKDVKPDPLTASPDVFFRDDDEMYYTLDQLGHDATNMEEFTMCELAINYGYRWSEEHEGWYHRDEVVDFMGGNFPKGVRRGIDESDDFEWASGFAWSKEMLDSMLTDCKTLRVTNFNVPQKQPYQSAGGPSVMFLTRCKDWWDYLNQLPLDDNGRGPSEWFTPEYYDRGHYGIIWNHYWRLNKKTPTLEMLDDEYTSAITTEWGYGIERQLNGTSSSEAWFVVDENNKPIYDLIPENVKGYAKIYEEYFFGDKINESEDDMDWIINSDTYYKVEQLEVGKTYQFVPDYSIMDKDSTWPQPHIEEAPDWISSYESQKFYIIKQEPNLGFPKLGMITFKQIGKSNEMIYDGKYTNISYTSRVFLWGKFKEVGNPTMVTESSDFDWAEGPITFTIDDIVGKQMYYRTNNVGINVNDIHPDDVVLGKIIWDKSYKLESHNGNDGVIVFNNPKDIPIKLNKRKLVNFSVDDIVTYVNLGIWSMEDDNGNIINDFSGRYIKESTYDDFDWTKESNPIQCKDLKGYYFHHVGDPRKFMIDVVGSKLPKGYDRDDLKVHYTWWDVHADMFDWGQMNCDTFIHRVKLGDYDLYGTDDKPINPNDLVYTDNTFDDDERKEIWEQGDLQWINDTNPYLFSKDEEWILVNDVDPNSIEESKEIQKYLITLGYTWSGGKTDLADYKIYTIHHFTSIGLRGFMTFYNNREGEVGLADRDIKKGEYDKLLYWSDIKSNDISLN